MTGTLEARARTGAAGGAVPLAVVVAALLTVGLVMVLSASSVAALAETGSPWSVFARQAVWVLAGVGAMAVCARLDYRHLRVATLPLVITSFVLLGLVLVPGVGITVNGSTRWLGLGAFRLQPAELAKLAVIVFAADVLSRRTRRLDDPRATLRPVVLVAGGMCVLTLLQPDLGTTVVLGALALVLLFASGAPLRWVAGLAGLAAAATALLSISAGYRRARILAFRDPFEDPLNTGYQTVQSLVGLASGGITGSGLGASRAKWGFLPNAHTDFIFAILGEELGFVGATVVLALFGAFAVLGVRTALRAPDRFGMLLAAGVTTWITAQALVNVGGVVGVLPITGIPLPFVSFGGSSMLVTLAGVGVLVSVARAGR